MEKILHGMGVSFGRAKGIVKIVKTPADHLKFQKGQILVTRITDPTMVPIMAKAAGIICEIGGLTSHPSIVSREMGIPCVVQAENAMKVLKEGQEVHLNGQTGEIHAVGAGRDWINDWIQAERAALGDMDIGTLQPYDWFQFQPLFAKEWLQKMEELVEHATNQKRTMKELARIVPAPGVIRDNLGFVLEDLKSARWPKEKRMKIAEFWNDLVVARYADDPYGLEGSSHPYSQTEMDTWIQTVPFEKGTPEIARLLGRIFSAGYNYAPGFYIDFYMTGGFEYYGPYSAEKRFGSGTLLVIKHFSDLKPTAMTKDAEKSPAKDIKIFSVYKNVQFQISPWITAHGWFTGNTIDNLIHWAVEVDGRFVNDLEELAKLEERLSEESIAQWNRLMSLDADKIKEAGVWSRCYCIKKLFDAVGMDWRPGEKMLAAVRGKSFVDASFWGVPKDKKQADAHWRKILDPRIDFFPPGANG